MEKLLAFSLILLLLPVWVVLSLLILITSGRPVFFVQKRVGKNGKVFGIWKFRTMRIGAEREKGEWQYLNEADGPVFKIQDDPRFTAIGKFLSHTGLDELPQFFNILAGQMSFVGPRPLPVEERNQIDKKYLVRETVNPGIVSPWIFDGYHNLGFQEWMESDAVYVRTKNVWNDLKLCLMAAPAFARMVRSEMEQAQEGVMLKDIRPARRVVEAKE